MKRLLHSTTAKTNWALILIAIIGVGILMGFIKIQNVDLSGIIPSWPSSSLTTIGGGNVTRKIEFTWTNKFSGAALTTKNFYIYDPSGVLLEGPLATDGTNGIKDSARTYTSGQILYIKYINTNDKVWYRLVVPTMSANDASSQTTNPVDLNAFAIGTYSATLSNSGTTYATNYEDSNGTTPVFKIEVTNTGADNTGMMDSAVADPVLNQMWQAYLVCKITGTGYETINVNGFDMDYTLGTTHWAVKKLDVNELCKWKIGNVYAPGYGGDQSLQFGVDLNGLTVNTTTLTYYAYAYADPSFAMTHGASFGSSVYQLATGSCALWHVS